jgi:hypothetical protein
LCADFKEDGLDFFGYFLPFKPNQVPLPTFQPNLEPSSPGWLSGSSGPSSFAASPNPTTRTLLKRMHRWLLRGSILELLVAVPSHIIVRRRGDCCAPLGTFWGIATGISVMLLCFGPGVFFLFVERFERLKPKSLERIT